MQILLDIVLPVFLVIGFGYLAAWRHWMSEEAIDGIMRFAQNFAVPCLLFTAIWSLDLQQSFDLRILVSFYTGAFTGFAVGALGARYFFQRDWEDAVAIGFVGLFSNTVLIGLPLSERAYGTEGLAGNFVIIALHSPLCYLTGITAMEIVRAKGKSPRQMALKVGRAMFRNALVIGVGLGALANLSGVALPGILTDALDMMVRAALPVALFGMGGVLYRYKPEGDLRVIGFICAVSLVLHPVLAWGMARWTGLGVDAFRSVVLTAAMAPGINAYLFANIYGRAKRVAASAVLAATAISVLSASFWLAVLP